MLKEKLFSVLQYRAENNLNVKIVRSLLRSNRFYIFTRTSGNAGNTFPITSFGQAFYFTPCFHTFVPVIGHTIIQTSLSKKQLSLKKNSSIYQRLEQLCDAKELSGIQGLAKVLGYNHAEKLYRLGREKNAKPSFDILVDLANLFEDLNLRWLISGDGNMFISPQQAYITSSSLTEPDLEYRTTLQTLISDKEKIISMLEAEVTRLSNELKKKSK